VIYDYARLNFVNTVLSKRKLQWFVDQGLVESWTDPRFPTVQGMVRRGLQVEALRDFISHQGVSKNTTLQGWDKLWSINKKLLDPVAPRHTAVEAAGRVRVTLTNGPAAVEVATVPKHNKNPAVGNKASYRAATVLIEQVDAQAVSEGEEITLMSWGNCVVREVARDAAGAVTGVTAELHLAGDVKKTKLKTTWLADVPELVELETREFGHLLTKAKVEEDDAIEDIANRDSVKVTAMLGDPNMRNLNRGDTLQLERKGFYIVDQAMAAPGQKLVLFHIPDGKMAK